VAIQRRRQIRSVLQAERGDTESRRRAVDPASHLQEFVHHRCKIFPVRPAELRDEIRLVDVQRRPGNIAQTVRRQRSDCRLSDSICIYYSICQLSISNINNSRSQWSSGSMSDCSARSPGIESRCGQLCLSHNHCDLQPWARAVCTLPAVPRSTQPSVGRSVNEYQLSG